MRLPSLRDVLLIDALGGAATAVMLGLVLPAFHDAIGLSPGLLRVLGAVGAVYGVYGFSAATLGGGRRDRALTVLIGANVLYCAASALVVWLNREAVTALGIAYFAAEIAVILTLVRIELAVRARVRAS